MTLTMLVYQDHIPIRISQHDMSWSFCIGLIYFLNQFHPLLF